MSEITQAIQFLISIEILGLAVWPITKLIFKNLPDKGWGFSKIIGLIFTGWLMWLLSSIQALPFRYESLLLLISLVAITSWLFIPKLGLQSKGHESNDGTSSRLLMFILVEELLFIGFYAGWTYLRGFSPDINGLEKFMDYGFMLSILKTDYFPPLDHYLARETINYYYFGHYLGAFTTLLSKVPAAIGYNLHMSLLGALCVIESFAIGAWLFSRNKVSRVTANASGLLKRINPPWRSMLAGLLTSIFITTFGNLHAIIYLPTNPETYWYPDATRFIENTIHEFPLYSFIVNDLHGHVSNIPNVLLIITLLGLYVFGYRNQTSDSDNNLIQKAVSYITYNPFLFAALSFFIGTSYATNSWDYAIYLFLTGLVLWFTNTLMNNLPTEFGFFDRLLTWPVLVKTAIQSATILGLSVVWYIPFWQTVTPIGKGIGLVPLDGHSPLWQLGVLWGIHIPLAAIFIFWVYRKRIRKWLKPEQLVKVIAQILSIKINLAEEEKENHQLDQNHVDNQDSTEYFYFGSYKIKRTHFFLVILFTTAILLVILPEFIYVKDIYPTHYRANTMFKLFYQSWILFGVIAGYSIVTMWNYFNNNRSFYGILYKLITMFLVFSGLLYTIQAIDQGFGGLKTHKGSINGITYLNDRLPGDAEAIDWINQNIYNQPTFIEAVGESYTDYARISANTGNPTVLGWPVHEWLWRGSYDQPFIPESQVQKRTGETDSVASRTADVEQFYTSNDPEIIQNIIDKYQIEYIYVGHFERIKYPSMDKNVFSRLETELVYDKNNTRIYRVLNSDG